MSLLALVLGGTAAQAALIVNYTATVTSGIVFSAEGDLVDLGGASLSGTLTLDRTLFSGAAGEFMSDAAGAFGATLRFERDGALVYTFDFATVEGTSSAAVSLQDSPDGASFVLSRAGEAGSASLSLSLTDAGSALITDIASLPEEMAFSGTGSTAGTFEVFLANGTSLSGDFSLTTLAAAEAVPEPSAWLMFIVGFGALGGALRRRGARAAIAA